MELRPGYKQTEVGVIPEDWGDVTLADVTTKIGSGITPTGGSTRYRDVGRPFVRSQNIGWGRLILDDIAFIDEETHEQFAGTEIMQDDVLLNITGASIGRCAIADDRIGGGNVNQHVCIIRPDRRRTLGRLIKYGLLSVAGQRQIESYQSGGNRQGLNFQQVAAIHFAAPPTLAEQSAIATALSDADSLIESLEDLIAKKRQIKQGAMQELLTGKRRLPGFSGAWEVKSLGDLFVFSAGVGASRDQLGHNGYCYLHYGDIHTSHKLYVNVRTEFNDIPKLSIPLGQIAPSSLLADGDVVFVDASEDDEGTSKHIVVINPDHIPFISGLHTIVAKAKNSMLGHRYRQYCFQTRGVKEQFRFYAVGTKVSGISKSNITKIVLPVPSLPEQTAIATILSDMDTELDALTAKLAKARQIKQGMMQELLTGRIRLI